MNIDKQEIKKSNIYTKKGDNGCSSLYNNEKRDKDDIIFEALGTLDELNATIGIIREYIKNLEDIDNFLIIIQRNIFDIGAAVATPRTSSNENKIEKTRFNKENIEILEKNIDKLDSELTPLTRFILPSGGLSSSFTHLARTICRRSERIIVSLYKNEDIEQEILKYLNRLSDYLFVLARWLAYKNKKEELYY